MAIKTGLDTLVLDNGVSTVRFYEIYALYLSKRQSEALLRWYLLEVEP